MKLIYLSEKNLNDRLFIKDFVHNYKLEGNTLMVHESFNDSIKDTRFVTKRISALLSEEMVYNNAFSADQRNFFHYQDHQLTANLTLMNKLFQTIQLLILSPVVKRGDEVILIDPQEMIYTMRNQTEVEELLTFTDNPLSPLAHQRPLITGRKDIEPLKKLYEEEQVVLERAVSLSPSRIVSPSNYAL